MFSGSFSLIHWLVVILLIMLLFGRGKISDLMGDMAKGINSFKKGLADDGSPPAHGQPPHGYVPPPQGYGQPQQGYAPQPQPYAPPHLAPPVAPQPQYAPPSHDPYAPSAPPVRDDVPRS